MNVTLRSVEMERTPEQRAHAQALALARKQRKEANKRAGVVCRDGRDDDDVMREVNSALKAVGCAACIHCVHDDEADANYYVVAAAGTTFRAAWALYVAAMQAEFDNTQAEERT